MKATEAIEELERLVTEFGDGELQLPDSLESWWYVVSRIEFERSDQVFRLVADR